MRKIVGPSACPGERAHDVISIVILEREWSLSFRAEILVTAVTNWTLLYHTCRKSYTTNNLGVPVKPFWYQSLFMYSTVNYDSHAKWRNTWFRLENKIEKQVILVQTKTNSVVRKGPLQVLDPFSVTPFLQVNRFQKFILLIVQYNYLKILFQGFCSPESDPPHKIMQSWVYYSTSWEYLQNFSANQNSAHGITISTKYKI